MKELYRKAVVLLEERTAMLIQNISHDEADPMCGYIRVETGLYEFGYNSANSRLLVCAYCSPDCAYYRKKEVLDAIRLMLRGMRKMIYEDGTTNNTISNFHQPELFSTPHFCLGYRVMRSLPSFNEEEKEVLDLMYELLVLIGRGLLTGGFHTPNHRWVITAAIYSVWSLLKPEDRDPALIERAEKYLAEKIDVDAYGEYSERSVGMYSAVSNRAFALIGIHANKPELFDIIKKNLILDYKYIERSTQLFTHNSRRSDKGEADGSRSFFYDIYIDTALLVYCKTKDPFFLQFISHILVKAEGRNVPLVNPDVFFAFPELRDLTLPAPVDMPELPDEYFLYQPENNVLRRKKNGAIVTVLADKYDFLYVTVGEITLSARICSSFFAIAQFYSPTIEKIGEDRYRLSLSVKADYKLPFDEPPAHSEQYWTMNYQSRPVALSCDYSYTVDVTLTEDGLSLHVVTAGQEAVPFKLEFAVTPGVYVKAGDAMTVGSAGQFISAAGGSVSLRDYHGDEIEIDGCFAKHFYHTGMRGSTGVPAGRFMVYLTDFSPVDRTVTIRCRHGLPWNYYD